ncbi:Lectin C-type domain, putative [Cyanobium sp. PCC 7001]|uniref:lectin-like protein n=1 Tax=Cyanobium sp. PCC 7001 TaxID=180281 RepID=UPI0001805011|nr:lectin-like protein [Cyanobium sp. PCC 7001]EDY38336.1 Lectin C-type domain, putative [Cyanobium sp. PCC 7001]
MSEVVDRLTGRGFRVFTRKRSAYVLLEGPLSWKKARKRARRLGGDLATVNNRRENRFLTKRFSPIAADDCGLWIGLKRNNRTGRFGWSSGQRAKYRNWLPAGTPGYRRAEPSLEASQKFVHLYFNPNAFGRWKNSDNTYRDVLIGGGIAEFSL